MNNLLNIKSFLKFLSRNKGYTAIDVFGLSVSLMFVILIAVYVERELNIDKQQANYDRIVAVGNEDFLESAVPVSYWLEERYPTPPLLPARSPSPAAAGAYAQTARSWRRDPSSAKNARRAAPRRRSPQRCSAPCTAARQRRPARRRCPAHQGA